MFKVSAKWIGCVLLATALAVAGQAQAKGHRHHHHHKRGKVVQLQDIPAAAAQAITQADPAAQIVKVVEHPRRHHHHHKHHKGLNAAAGNGNNGAGAGAHARHRHKAAGAHKHHGHHKHKRKMVYTAHLVKGGLVGKITVNAKGKVLRPLTWRQAPVRHGRHKRGGRHKGRHHHRHRS